MNVRVLNHPQRRGACPGLSTPMPTGDGLLVRLLPIGTIPLAAFTELCAAARANGNGNIEITARGSLQVRGLSTSSAPRFAAAVATLDIAAADGIPVLSSPLSGLEAKEIVDASALAADLRRTLAKSSLAVGLAAKVSAVVDGGGSLNLDALAADVRLCAEATNNGVALRVSGGGDAARATQLGMVAPGNAVEASMRLLEFIARRGRDVRARDVLAAEGSTALRATLADIALGDAPPSAPRGCKAAIGRHPLHDGSIAYGVGLAFGHADATTLIQLSEAAIRAGACGWRTAGRTLLAIGLTDGASSHFAADAERLGFIVRADDRRRQVVACVGAPTCFSAQIAARAIAPAIAQACAPYLDRSFTIHISGCAKGCAHPARAPLTIVGTPGGCALIADGSTHDVADALVSSNELPAAIADLLREREAGHV